MKHYLDLFQRERGNSIPFPEFDENGAEMQRVLYGWDQAMECVVICEFSLGCFLDLQHLIIGRNLAWERVGIKSYKCIGVNGKY